MRLAILTALLLLACDAPRPASEPAASAPRPLSAGLPARVITIRESSHPPTRALLHRIVVAGDKVRLTSELDRWRLFDLEQGTVTFVDEIAGTYRTASLEDLVRARRRQLDAALPSDLGPAAIRNTGRTREVAGLAAEQWCIELGGYQRELWITGDPLAGEGFFRMWLASEPLSEPWAGIMRPVHEQLLELEGFPLIDRSQLVWDGGALLVQRALVGVEESRVPPSLFEVPEAFEDATPPSIRSAGGRPSAS